MKIRKLSDYQYEVYTSHYYRGENILFVGSIEEVSFFIKIFI